VNQAVMFEQIEEVLRVRKACHRSMLSKSCLYPGQPAMLGYICDHPGCSQKQIADRLGVTPASVAISLKRLESAHLITRRADTADTRCNRVYITQAGEKELDYCLESLEAFDFSVINALSESETEMLEVLLLKLKSALKEGKENI